MTTIHNFHKKLKVEHEQESRFASVNENNIEKIHKHNVLTIMSGSHFHALHAAHAGFLNTCIIGAVHLYTRKYMKNVCKVLTFYISINQNKRSSNSLEVINSDHRIVERFQIPFTLRFGIIYCLLI